MDNNEGLKELGNAITTKVDAGFIDVLHSMRLLTATTGQIYEAHPECIYKWPYIVLSSEIKNLKAKYDQDKKLIEYEFKIVKGGKPTKETVDILSRSIKYLLGNEWNVRLKEVKGVGRKKTKRNRKSK
jgi:hypothetical protein